MGLYSNRTHGDIPQISRFNAESEDPPRRFDVFGDFLMALGPTKTDCCYLYGTVKCFFCQQVQQSCNSSSASPDTNEEPCPTDMVKMTKSKTFQAYLPSCHRTYSCIHCRAHLANHDELISKSHATLFAEVPQS